MKSGCVKILIKYLAVIRDSAGREQEEISFPRGALFRTWPTGSTIGTS